MRVDVQAGDLVDQIILTFDNGTAATFGERGGRAQPPFIVPAGEFLASIEGRRGSSLDAVRFVTNAGTRSALYGNANGGRSFALKAPTGEQIVGLTRDRGFCPPIIGLTTVGAERGRLFGSPC